MLSKLKILYPALDENILSLLLDSAQQFILDYCGLDSYDETLDGILLRMCQEDINTLHSEGFNSESAEGVSVSYNGDYSERVYKALNRRKKIRTVH